EQPDGSKVKVVLYGDEYYMRGESLDGYTVIRDTQTGWICYADINEDGSEFISTGIIYRDDITFEEATRKFFKDWKGDSKVIQKIKNIKPKLDLKREYIDKKIHKNKMFIKGKLNNDSLPAPDEKVDTDGESYPAPPTRKALGTIKGLVIIVDFPDYPAEVSLDEYNRWFNDMNYTNYSNNGSVRKYFYDISEGKLDYQGVVFGIFRATNTFAYYDSLPYGQGARQILAWTLSLIDQQGFDFSTLSTDSNRNILAINLVHTGNPRNWAEGMWYHQGTYTGFTADGVRSRLYATMPANTPLRIGTACHENGHMVCGWPDTYKYDSNTGPDGIGAFDLMCSINSYTNPVPPNPYFLYTVGWASFVDVNDWAARIIFDTANDLIFYRYRNPNNSREFYILNTVRKTGRYANVPDEGLCIWRIDEDGDNQTTRHMVYLVHANNDITNHTRACFRADRGYDKFNAYTTPSATWYGDITSFLNVCTIGNVASTMTYRVYDLDKEWYFLSNHEGWNTTYNASVSVSTGSILSLNITASGAYIMSADNLMISATTYKYIKIRLRNTTNQTQARFFWITSTDTQWNDVKSVSFTITSNDTDFGEYVIDLSRVSSWSGRIRRLRFAPSSSSGRIDIDYIRLEKDPGITSGKIYAIKSKHSGKFISVQNNSDAAGTNIVQLDYQGLLGQCWKIEDVGDSYYRFTSLRNNLVFDIKNVDVSNGAELIQWSWSAGDGQKFKIDGLTLGDYRLTARHSGKALDVEGQSLEDNARVIQWDWHGGNNQIWNFVLTHDVDVSINPVQAGSVSRSLNYERYLNGTQLTLTATPSKGYRFVSWSGSYNSLQPVLQINVTDDIQLTANFTLTTHTIVVSVLPFGSAVVDIQPKQDYYTYGTTVTLRVIPNEGYEFVKWSGDIDNSLNPLEIVVEGDLNLTANLRLTTHTLTITISPSQAAEVEIIPYKEYYTYFDTVTIRFTTNEGYEFLGWSGSYTGYDNPLLLEVKGDINLYANFKLTTHTVSVIVNPQGSGEYIIVPQQNYYTYGSTISIKAIPNTGWYFTGWSGDITEKNTEILAIIKSNLVLYANFKLSTYTVVVNIEPVWAGEVKITPYLDYYTYGSTITLQAIPKKKYKFKNWNGDIVGDTPVIVFIVDSEKHIIAEFIQISDYLLSLNSDNINDEIYFGEDVREINIYSHKGSLIKNIKANKINSSISKDLSIGFYILELKTSDDKKRFEKLVVVK
ncbi:MAG: M6 family metalloprotease domain-containing protein, partial [candidate division WOR-3 bacterium]